MKWTSGTVLVLILGIVLGMGYLVLAMYMLLGVLLLSLLLSRRWDDGLDLQRDSLALVRRDDAPLGALSAGDGLKVSITLANRGLFRIPWVFFEDSVPDAAAVRIRGRSMGVVRLRRRETHIHEYRVEFRRRGYHPLGPLLVETGDLFGLHRKFRIATVPQFFLVLPRLVPLSGGRIASRRHSGDVPVLRHLFEDPTRIAGVRPYVPGDPFHRIHWKATARTGEIHSRVFEHSCTSGALFLLDFGRGAWGRPASGELAVTAVASFARALMEKGQPAGLLSNGRDAAERYHHEGWAGRFTTSTDRGRSVALSSRKSVRRAPEPSPAPPERSCAPVHLPPRSGIVHLFPLLEALARLEESDTVTLVDLLRHHTNLLPRHCCMVPVIEQVTDEVALALGMLRERGYAVTALLIRSEDHARPDWARPPAWVEPLLIEGVDFHIVNDEDSLRHLSPEALFA